MSSLSTLYEHLRNTDLVVYVLFGCNQSFNPISEPSNDWGSKLDGRPELEQRGTNLDTNEQISEPAGCTGVSSEGDKDFSFACGLSLSVDDDELTESKIQAFLDEKVLFSVEESKLAIVCIHFQALLLRVELEFNMLGS